MREDCPSKTALRVAIHRAAHQVIDDVRVFEDPLALRILGMGNEPLSPSDPRWPKQTPISTGMRAFVTARSRFAEDALHFAVRHGTGQYVVLGAGLDTFAFRSTYPEDVLRVFEVDHPATQAWKRECLRETGIPIPSTLTFAPVDLERETLEQGLLRVGFDAGKCAFFSWLGVTQYLAVDKVAPVLQFVASMPSGSGIVFDYTISPSLLNPTARATFEKIAHHVAMEGEPFQSTFVPSELRSSLMAMGFSDIEDLGPAELNALYFQGCTDKLKVGGFARLVRTVNSDR